YVLVLGFRMSYILSRVSDYASILLFFFQAEDGIRDRNGTGVQTCALPISLAPRARPRAATESTRRRVRRTEGSCSMPLIAARRSGRARSGYRTRTPRTDGAAREGTRRWPARTRGHGDGAGTRESEC